MARSRWPHLYLRPWWRQDTPLAKHSNDDHVPFFHVIPPFVSVAASYYVCVGLQHLNCLQRAGINTCATLLTKAWNGVGQIVWLLLLPKLSGAFKNGTTDSLVASLRVTLLIVHRNLQFCVQHLSFLTRVVPPPWVGSCFREERQDWNL